MSSDDGVVLFFWAPVAAVFIAFVAWSRHRGKRPFKWRRARYAGLVVAASVIGFVFVRLLFSEGKATFPGAAGWGIAAALLAAPFMVIAGYWKNSADALEAHIKALPPQTAADMLAFFDKCEQGNNA